VAIVDDVNAQLKDAMKSQDKDRLKALRNIRAAFIAAMKDERGLRDTLTDEEAIGILRKLAKTRQESIEAYRAGGREDLVAEEQKELVHIDAFLPQLAGEDVVRGWVKEAIAAVGATSPKEMGKVMGKVMADHKAEADGKLVQRLAKELLGG
jgi:uncharacterized protein YqeY